jgi:plasmid stabilization system protein ParE
MVRRVEWSDNSIKQYKTIIFYHKENDNTAYAQKWVDSIWAKIDFLMKEPEIGRRAAKTKTIRFVRVAKHYHLFYRIKGSTLFISSIFDTRQNPSKRPF